MSTIKMHTLARVPRDYDREAALADKRFHALAWMLEHGTPEALAVHGWDGLTDATVEAKHTARELALIQEGA